MLIFIDHNELQWPWIILQQDSLDDWTKFLASTKFKTDPTHIQTTYTIQFWNYLEYEKQNSMFRLHEHCCGNGKTPDWLS